MNSFHTHFIPDFFSLFLGQADEVFAVIHFLDP